MVGKNGAGKTSLIESIDYTFYNKVKAKNKKWLTLSKLPNRINGDMLTRIKFKTSDGVEVEVKRGQNPSILELWENGILNERAGKSNINAIIEKYIGMDVETFKSFISMSINDFKNFISLNPTEKKLLLDKLFNLEVINTMNDILKQMVKDNKSYLKVLDKEISTYDESISSIKSSIKRVKERKEISLESDIKLIKENILSKKGEYEELKEKIEKIEKTESKLEQAIREQRDSIVRCKSEVSQIDKQLKVYDSGKCPTCNSDLSTDEHLSIKKTFEDKKEVVEKTLLELKDKLSTLKTKKEELDIISGKASDSFYDIKSLLKGMKSEVTKLEAKNEDKGVDEDIEEFEKTITELDSKLNSSKIKSEDGKTLMEYHKELANVFSEKGVKRTIIKNILDPINVFIKENLSFMKMPFEVELDETFNATITQLGEEIESETLSTGEMKRVNVSILLAYIKLIRTKRNINILFLDEVFASIDIEGVDDILSLLKDFSNQYNINIFVVHHAQLETELFDRVINMKKDIFTTIEEEKWN